VLLLLLPLRGFAAAQMVVPTAPAHAACHESVADAASSLLQGSGAVDVVLSADAAAPSPGDTVTSHDQTGSACACCLFCAPALPCTATAIADLWLDRGTRPLAEPGATPEGVRDALFRPPRG